MLAEAMATVFFSWCFLIAVYVGVGLLVRRAMGVRTTIYPGVFLSSFWMGWAVSILFLQLWHLLFRLDLSLVFIGLAGGAGLLWNGRVLGGALARLGRGEWLVLALIGAVGVWVSNLCIGAPIYYDTGLYHLPMMRWLSSFPIVPGLGNLHGRFAYNNSSLLYVAMLDSSLWTGKAHSIANGLFVWVLWAQVLSGVVRILRDPRNVSAHHVFSAMWLPIVLKECANANTGQFIKIVSLSPDVAVLALGGFLGMALLRFMTVRSVRGREADWALAVVIAVASVGVTVKLSFLAYGFVAVCLGVWTWWARSEKALRARRVGLAWALGAGVLLIAPWCVRGVILSGYPAYPSTFMGFPVEWRIPEEAVRYQADIAIAWARHPRVDPEEVLANWDWLDWWFSAIRGRHIWLRVPVTMGLAGCLAQLLLVVARLLHTGRGPRVPSRAWLFVLAPLLGLVFWFFTAPNARFAPPFAWAFGAGAIALLVREVRRGEEGGGGALAALALSLFCLIYFFPGVMGNEWGFKWNEAGPSGGFYPAPQVPLRRVAHDGGLVVQVPLQGDQVWNAPLPAAPKAVPGLRLRKQGDLSSGFMRSDTE